MGMLRCPKRLETALFHRAAEIAGRHGIVGEEHGRAELHLGLPRITAEESNPRLLSLRARRSNPERDCFALLAMTGHQRFGGALAPPPRWACAVRSRMWNSGSLFHGPRRSASGPVVRLK